jgi:hypothetical protein
LPFEPIKFYADVHIAEAVAKALRGEGIDFVRAIERVAQDAPDETHLKAAFHESRVIVTQDADFLALHESGVKHCGIVYFPQGAGIGYIVSQLLLLFSVCSAEELVGRVEFL